MKVNIVLRKEDSREIDFPYYVKQEVSSSVKRLYIFNSDLSYVQFDVTVVDPTRTEVVVLRVPVGPFSGNGKLLQDLVTEVANNSWNIKAIHQQELRDFLDKSLYA